MAVKTRIARYFPAPPNAIGLLPNLENTVLEWTIGKVLRVAETLSQANVITNKNLTPDDTPADWDTPGGIRLGTIEVTRLGMKEAEMVQIADFIHRVLVEKEAVSKVAGDVADFRQGFQKVHYCSDFVAAGLNTVLRSTDGGETWAMYNEGIEDLWASTVAFSPDWAHDQTLFAAGYGPTHRSTDGGASWQPLSSHLPPLYDLALSPNYGQDRTLFACYRESEPSAVWPESGVVRSTDGGETWELASMGLPGTYDPWARSIALSPNFATDRTLFLAYRGTGHQGPDQVFCSTDAGDTWVSLPPIPGEPHIHALAVTGPDAVHVATDNGVWHYNEETPLDIVINGGFEEGFYLLGGQSIAGGWAAYTLWGQPTFAGERFTVHSGRWAYKISGYAPFTAGLVQAVSVQPGKTYRVTAYYQLYPPGDGQALLGVQDGTFPTRWGGSPARCVAAVSRWRRLS